MFEELVLEYSSQDDSEDRLLREDWLSSLWLDGLLLFEDVDELFDRLVSELDESEVRLDVELIDWVELERLLDSLLRLDVLDRLSLLDDSLKAPELELDMLVCEDSLSSVLELLCDTDEMELVLEILNPTLDELDDDVELLELSELETLVDELLDADENRSELSELELDDVLLLLDELLEPDNEMEVGDEDDDSELTEVRLVALDRVLDDGDELL